MHGGHLAQDGESHKGFLDPHCCCDLRATFGKEGQAAASCVPRGRQGVRAATYVS